MATITSATSGDYGTGATWVGGIAPVEGDKVVIARTSTGAETFSTDTAGYAIGATAITLTGAVAAGSYVIGEAVQFGSDPNYYTITNWNSGTKVLTVSPLIVAIPASATLVRCKGHAITVAGTYIAGDDTTSAFTVNGTLIASRSVNSSLTIKGDLVTGSTVAATIDYGRRSLSNPIPAGVTATLILNYSAAMSNYKYGLFIAEISNAFFCGATRTRNTTTTSSLSAGGTSVDVADITGWAVNDWIVFAETDGTTNHYDRKQIATITPTTGTAGTVTFTATTYAHATGCPVGNFSSNVTIKSYNTTNPAYFCNRYTTTSSNNRRELDYVTFEYVGSDSTSPTTKAFIASGTSGICNPFLTWDSCSFYNGNNQQNCFINTMNSQSVYNDHAFFSDAGVTGAQIYSATGSYYELRNSVFYYTSGTTGTSAFSQGGQGVIYRGCKFWTAASTSTAFTMTNGSGIRFYSCQFHSAISTAGFVWLQSNDIIFENCSFGSSDLPGSPSMGYIADAGTTLGQRGMYIFRDCLFGTPGTSFYKNLSNAHPEYITYVSNKNVDPSVQEIYTANGTIERDNTSKLSGVTSLKMLPTSATNALTFTVKIPAPTGNLVGVSGTLYRDTANTATVTLSGLGITASTYTASGAINTSETFFVSGTNTTGTDGLLTLTFSVTGASGTMWVDALSAPQASAIDFGQFGYWSDGSPAEIITANYVSGSDVWNTLLTNVTVPASMGMEVRNIRPSIG